MVGYELLASIANQTDEHEFYTPVPKNYKPGKTKYIVTMGTVISGLGKGIFGSSLAKLLQFRGLSVTQIKIEGYLNIDSGTLNPFRHGEVFVLDDGMECDMDLGTYERFLNQQLTKDNFLTNGQILRKVLDKERQGNYLGRDVQFLPHVTGEIKNHLRELAVKTNVDVILVEIGGTVGEIENAHYIEAMRQLAYEEGKENVCFAALTYVLQPGTLREQKSKAAQLGIKALLESGIQPDIIACRCEQPVSEKVREKISIHSNVPMERVISCHDVKNIYSIPLLLKDAQLDDSVMEILQLRPRISSAKQQKMIQEWVNFIERREAATQEVVVGITGKYTGLRDSYASIIEALYHAGTEHDVKVRIQWIETTEIEDGTLKVDNVLADVDGIIVPGGFGARGAEGKILCVQYARENNLPYLGLCYGFQMAVIEYARHICGLKHAHSTEIDPKTKEPVIDVLPEQKKIEGLGGNMRLGGQDVELKEGTKAYELYGQKKLIRERFRHRYEVDPDYISLLEQRGMVFSGKAPKYPIMQILEIPTHPFFVGTQYHPEFTSRPLSPHPLFSGFVAALKAKKQ
ncbi:CTP synthase (glutamine hydrolyzing) [Candidatus Woesearchaeota archaeon]|nr:CTP synthase (glutamine hydrolyzing) [Candidatus Woesearchaeota archaeon]